MIPDDWKQSTLSNVCRKQISYGIVQTGPETNGGIPCLRVVDLTKRKISINEMITTSNEINDAYKKTILEKNEIVMALRGVVGLARIVDESLVGANITRGLARISPKTDIVYPEFLLWELRSPKLRSDLLRRVGGSALQEISLGELRKVKTLVPPLPEQTKIANILTTSDKAIETVEKLIDNSRAQKKALMQQLLTGKKRLPGFKKEWKNVKISSIADITMGSSPKSEAYNNDNKGLPLLQGNADIKNRESAPRAFTSQITKSCQIGDVLLSVRAPVGEVSISKHHACIGRGIAALREKPNSYTSTSFIYQILLYKESHWARLSQGSTFDCVNSNDIKNLHIFSPDDKDEKIEIARVLETQDIIEKNYIEQLQKLKQQKISLMQQLLTGKRRVTTG